MKLIVAGVMFRSVSGGQTWIGPLGPRASMPDDKRVDAATKEEVAVIERQLIRMQTTSWHERYGDCFPQKLESTTQERLTDSVSRHWTLALGRVDTRENTWDWLHWVSEGSFVQPTSPLSVVIKRFVALE